VAARAVDPLGLRLARGVFVFVEERDPLVDVDLIGDAITAFFIVVVAVSAFRCLRLAAQCATQVILRHTIYYI
jgi:hypothetical protein